MRRIDAATRAPSLPNLLQGGDSEREPAKLRSWCTNGTSRIEFRSTNYIERGHCATSRKVAGSIPDGVIGIFHGHNPSVRTMALGSTQSLTEMSTRNVSWGLKAAGA